MAKKKSNTAALVEGETQHPERLSIEETWPAETQPLDQDDGTEPFGAAGAPMEMDGSPDVFADEFRASLGNGGSLGLSNSGPFIAPAPVSEAPASTTTGKRAKLTVSSMTREHAFSTFRDKLFELCFKYGFTLLTDAQGHTHNIQAYDIGDAKGTAKRALAVGNHISGLELRK